MNEQMQKSKHEIKDIKLESPLDPKRIIFGISSAHFVRLAKYKAYNSSYWFFSFYAIVGGAVDFDLVFDFRRFY